MENRTFTKFQSDPTSTCATEIKRKQTLRKKTTINCSLKTIQHTRVKHKGREIIPHANMCRQKTSLKLGRPTPRDLKLTRMSYSRSGIFLSFVFQALAALNRGWGIPLHDAQGMALYVREGFRAFGQSRFECGCHESCVVRICGKVNNFYVYAFYRIPDHDGSLYDCMLGSTIVCLVLGFMQESHDCD